MRRSRIGRPRVSASGPPPKAGAAPLLGALLTRRGMTFFGADICAEDDTPAGGSAAGLGTRAVALLLEVALLLGGLWIDLALHRACAFFFLRCRGGGAAARRV